MAGSADADETDDALVSRLAQGDDTALVAILSRHGPRVKGYLRQQFGTSLRAPELEEVLNEAACNLWKSIGTYRSGGASLLGWFISIAHNAALDELRRGRRHRAGELTTEPAFRPTKASDCKDEGPARKAETAGDRRLRLMWHVITAELKGNQRAVALADLEAPSGKVDGKTLAAKLGIPVAQVYVTRSQARKRIRERVLRLEQETTSRTGNP